MPLSLEVELPALRGARAPLRVELEEGDWPRGPWPIGVLHAVRPKVSISPVELEYDGRVMQIRTFRAGAVDDLLLAHEIANGLGGELQRGDLRELENGAADDVLALLARMAVSTREARLVGPFGQAWYVGPKHAARMAATDDPVGTLHGRARLLLWADRSEDLFVARTPFQGGLLLQPDVPTVFREAGSVVLEALDLSKTVSVAPDVLADLLGEAFLWLDERSFVAHVRREQWADLVAGIG